MFTAVTPDGAIVMLTRNVNEVAKVVEQVDVRSGNDFADTLDGFDESERFGYLPAEQSCGFKIGDEGAS
ncbi:hypothetical protein [Mycobacterium marinum]|uniref:hypothetical protein n=1 Tax=Mycobacterium marinum TaxID=1781 RepID=UPI0011400B96|nr:hypothetical protein [Mycobacterium marinum]